MLLICSVRYLKAERTMTWHGEMRAHSSCHSMYSCSIWAYLINWNKSITHKRSMLFIVSLTASYTCSLRQGLWSCIQTDSKAFNSFLSTQGPKVKQYTAYSVHYCIEHLPWACSVSCLGYWRQSCRPVSCGIRLERPDWTLMGSYDVASLGICSCWLQAEELWHTMRCLIFCVVSYH